MNTTGSSVFVSSHRPQSKSKIYHLDLESINYSEVKKYTLRYSIFYHILINYKLKFYKDVLLLLEEEKV